LSKEVVLKQAVIVGTYLFQPAFGVAGSVRLVPSLVHRFLHSDRDADYLEESFLKFNYDGQSVNTSQMEVKQL
jgi:hypothetical protein